ncbi:MAG: protein kinase [Gemmatimonadales bacterium]|jgi:tetratricopeptide (TPR) repeat protein
MPAVRLESLEEIFEHARSLPPRERETFLESCSDDPGVRDELASLLEAAAAAEPFFAELAAVASPTALVGEAAGPELALDRVGLPEGSGLEVGDTVAQYRLEEKLGAGGMGVVYRATDTRLEREVALKFLPPHLSADEAAKERFLVEARAAAALDHPNLCALHEIGQDADGRMYIAMGYYRGQTLSRALEQGPLPIEEALDYARQIGAGLRAAHARGIVHRDIKPGNILITRNGTAMVLDFGLAKLADVTLTDVGTRLGTVAYMSPEQTRADEAVDYHTDLWSLGVVLYEMLTGRRPFRGDSDRVTIHAIRHETPTQPSKLRKRIPADLDTLVLRLLDKKPEARESGARWLLERAGPSRLGRLLLEAHRRSVWQVLVAWAVAGGAIYALSGPLGDSIGLPFWFERGVLVALLVVLALLMVTGMARGRRRAALRGLDQPRFSWQNAGLGSAAAFALLGVATAGYLALRALGIGPFGTVIAKDQLEPQSEIVLAGFASAPEDSALARTVTEAFRIDFSQSPSVRLAGPGRVGTILGRMERPAGGRLDAEMAREVAIRGGIPAVIDGEIRRLGEGFVLTAQLLSPAETRVGSGMPSSGPPRVLARNQATAASEDDLMSAIDRLSKGLRERIGEPLTSLRQTQALPELTTSSVAALQKYLEGVTSADDALMIRHLQEAVALDSDFAEAWRKLGIALVNSGQERGRQVRAFARAFELRNRLTDRERYLVEATYYRRVTGEYAKAIEATQAYLARYPDVPYSPDNHFLAWFSVAARQWLALAYRDLRRYERAEEVLESSLREYPVWTCSSPALALAETLLDLGKRDEARRYADWLLRRCVDMGEYTEAWVFRRVAAVAASGLGDYEAAERHFQAELAAGPDDPLREALVAQLISALYAVQGRLADARAAAREATAAYQRSGLSSDDPRMAIEEAARDAFLTRAPQRILPDIDAELARTPISGLDSLDRPYLPLVTLYAQAGRTQAARALLAEFESAVEPRLRGPLAAEHGRARGELALAERRYSEAVAAFRTSDVGACNVCALPGLARAYDAAGQTDSAIAVFRRYVETPSSQRLGGTAYMPGIDHTYLGPSLERLAQLYDGRGEQDQAATYYARFVELWKDADPELQPRVDVARARLAGLPPPPAPKPTTGALRVRTTSSGEDLDPSGYLVTVGEDERSIGSRDSLTFRFIPLGDVTVRLRDLADNCAVVGESTRQATVTGGTSAEVAFDVSCATLRPAEVDVTGTWRGSFDGTSQPWRRRSTGTLTYVLEQSGDEVTADITYDDPAWRRGPSTRQGTGRVSGSTLTLFYLGFPSHLREGPARITATLDIVGDEMTGSDEEQQGVWEATITVSRRP